MNRLETWFCGSSFWRYVTRRQLLPWILEGSELGEHVLELGAGLGAATGELRRRAPRVTSLEYDHGFAAKLEAGARGAVVQGDASRLPFADKTFSSAIAILVLHHLPSCEAQDLAFSEIFRVLKPGGVFLALEIPNGWWPRLSHFKSTFVPMDPESTPARLTAAGLSDATVVCDRKGFRMRAFRGEIKRVDRRSV